MDVDPHHCERASVPHLSNAGRWAAYYRYVVDHECMRLTHPVCTQQATWLYAGNIDKVSLMSAFMDVDCSYLSIRFHTSANTKAEGNYSSNILELSPSLHMADLSPLRYSSGILSGKYHHPGMGKPGYPGRATAL